MFHILLMKRQNFT